MTVTNATRKLDPCGQYKEHKLEDLVLACGILPTHIDENNPESLMTQVARICNTVPEQHLIREAIHMDEDGVVYGDDQSIKYFLGSNHPQCGRTLRGTVHPQRWTGDCS